MSLDRTRRAGASVFSLHMGSDASARCLVREGEKPPLLLVDDGRASLSLSAAGAVLTDEHVEFAYTLLGAVNDYLIACEQIVFTRRDQTEPPPFTETRPAPR